MNILYICTPNSIHDQKWMSYFAEKKEYSVFVVGEFRYSAYLAQELANKNMELLPSISPFSIAHPLKNYQSIQQLKGYIRKYKIDLVHVLFATPYALWTNYIKTPYFITTRGSDVLVVLPELKRATIYKRIYFNWLYNQFKKAFKKAQKVTSTSELQQSKIKEMFQVKADVIRTGVEVEQIRQLDAEAHLPVQLQKKELVFSPRFMSDIYNISYQIDAIELLSSELLKKYTFLFIKGKSYNQTYFEIQLDRLNQIKSKSGLDFIVLDYLTQKELWATFKNAKLTIMTPKSDGTPNSALEAMAARSPLIVSDLPYDKSLFVNTCEKIALDNPKVFTEKMEEMLRNPPSQEELNKTFETVKTHGSRPLEMEKLASLYKCSTIK